MSESEHNWGHRGINPPERAPSVRGNLWDSWARIVISFVLGVASAIYIVGGKSRDLSDLVAWKTKIDTKLEEMNREGTQASKANDKLLFEWKGKIDTKLESLDKDGTQAARVRLEEETRELGKIDARLAHVESDTRHIEVIEVEHQRLTNDVEKLKQRK